MLPSTGPDLTPVAGTDRPPGMYLALPPPDPSIEVVVASRGYSKGLAQTDGPQLLVRGEAASGPLFLGAYWKNVTSPVLDGEAGVLVGARGSLSGFDLQGTAAYKHSTGIDGPTDGDAFEFVASASRHFGVATVRLAVTWSPDELGATGKSLYLEAGAGVEIGEGTTASANIGRRERAGGSDYTSFNLGLTQRLTPNVIAELRYYDTAQSALGDTYRGRLVASARLRF